MKKLFEKLFAKTLDLLGYVFVLALVGVVIAAPTAALIWLVKLILGMLGVM